MGHSHKQQKGVRKRKLPFPGLLLRTRIHPSTHRTLNRCSNYSIVSTCFSGHGFVPEFSSSGLCYLTERFRENWGMWDKELGNTVWPLFLMCPSGQFLRCQRAFAEIERVGGEANLLYEESCESSSGEERWRRSSSLSPGAIRRQSTPIWLGISKITPGTEKPKRNRHRLYWKDRQTEVRFFIGSVSVFSFGVQRRSWPPSLSLSLRRRLALSGKSRFYRQLSPSLSPIQISAWRLALDGDLLLKLKLSSNLSLLKQSTLEAVGEPRKSLLETVFKSLSLDFGGDRRWRQNQKSLPEIGISVSDPGCGILHLRAMVSCSSARQARRELTKVSYFLFSSSLLFPAAGGKRDQQEIERPSDNDENPSARRHRTPKQFEIRVDKWFSLVLVWDDLDEAKVNDSTRCLRHAATAKDDNHEK